MLTVSHYLQRTTRYNTSKEDELLKTRYNTLQDSWKEVSQ
jgi:hypothetical protein